MTGNLKSFLHHAWLSACADISARRRWRDGAENGGVFVYYGHDHVPTSSEAVGGGVVKCQDLARIFPNTLKRANLVYLVSSVLPYGSEIMIRHARRAGAKFVWNQNGVAYPAWHGPGWEIVNTEMSELLHEADHVFYQSTFCRQSADLYLGRKNGPSEVLYNPVDTKIFVPGQRRRDGLRLLLAGSHQHAYRVISALETLALLKDSVRDVRLTVAGKYSWKSDQDDARHEVKKWAKQHGVEDVVDFRGEYSQNQAVSLMQEHDILLHTKYNDPCPRLVVEAMACGIPVVYSASGGVTELVGEEGGVGVPALLDWNKDIPPDPEKMALAVKKVAESLEAFSLSARHRAVARFDVRPWIDRHETVFKLLVC